MDLGTRTLELLWTGSLAAPPIVLLVALLCRLRGMRPATRHALWLTALVSFISPLLGSLLWRPEWFASERVLASLGATGGLERVDDAAPAIRERSTAAAPAVVKSETSPADAISNEAPPRTALAVGSRDVSPPSASPFGRGGSSPRVGASRGGPSVSAIGHVGPAMRDADRDYGLPGGSGDMPSAPLEQISEPGTIDKNPVGSSAFDEPAESHGVLPRGAAPAWSEWLASVLRLRDDLAGVPPLPAAIWLGGVGVLIVVQGVRVLRASRLVASARPANRWVTEEAQTIARFMGLRTSPETLMVPARVSPMIWCGFRTRLLLPAELWPTLDRDSRRSVLVHELAHLARLDHRVCWLESIIGTLFWWHPVAWWARRRIRDEADASCDAWVTSLFPSSRRRYAEALLVTKAFVGLPGPGAGPCLGVVHGRTKKLARRITMVMTQRPAPRVSMVGVTLACLIAAAGAFVTPGLACPPEGQKTSEVKVKVYRAQKQKAGSAAGAGPSEGGVEFFGEAPALEALKRRGALGNDAIAPTPPPSIAFPAAPRAPRAPRPVMPPHGMQGMPPASAPLFGKVPGQPIAQRIDGVAVADGAALFVPMHTTPRGIAVLRGEQGPLAALGGTSEQAAQEVREYQLPKGKLEALTSLMSRADVPVLIERRNSGLVVHATPGQHEIFAAFVKLINPEGDTDGASHWRISVQRPRFSEGAKELAEMERAKIELDRRRALLEAERAKIEGQAERVREQAEGLSERGERLREISQELRSQAAESRDDVARDTLHATADQMRERASSLLEQARAMERQAGDFERRIEDLERQVEELESRLESLTGDADESAVADDVDEVEVFVEAPEVHEAVEEEAADCDGEESDDDDEVSASQSNATSAIAPAVAPARRVD